MPTLVKNGPNIPEGVLQALEEESLVLFCGAGISMGAGLPSYKRLVKRIYVEMKATKSESEKKLFDLQDYGAVWNLFEQRHNRNEVRFKVEEILKKSFNGRLSLHKYLLELSSTSENVYHMVTTNFDDLFKCAGANESLIDAAPKLPIPKKSSWGSLVYLHGRLGDPSDPSRNNLIISSSDFGSAYLVDRWASRFITELFRNFKVLFIGYRVEDPPMKYLMDALSAARSRGERYHEAYAFVHNDGDSDEKVKSLWESKGITPIIYKKTRTHYHLHRSIKRWSHLHTGGFMSRLYVVVARDAYVLPSTGDEEEVKRVIWAIKEPLGRIASGFSNLSPSPSVKWLKIFDNKGLLHLSEDVFLARDNTSAESHNMEQVGIPLVDGGGKTTGLWKLHPVTLNLGLWLVRHHLDSSELIRWCLSKGAVLHTEIRHEIRLVLNGPNSISGAKKVFWEVLSSDYFANLTSRFMLESNFMGIPENKNSIFSEQRIADLLTPVPRLYYRDPISEKEIFGDTQEDDGGESELSRLVDVDVELIAGDSTRQICECLTNDRRLLVRLFNQINAHLETAMNWHAIFEKATNESDSSYSDCPSIDEHSQNSDFRGWANLIPLLRDGWIEIYNCDKSLAFSIACQWRSGRFPIIRRLYLYAVLKSEGFLLADVVTYLVKDRPEDLWSFNVQREVLQIFRLCGSEFLRSDMKRLCDKILKGPPKIQFKNMTPKRWKRFKDREIWLALSKLEQGEANFTKEARKRLDELSEEYSWELKRPDMDEFPLWVGPLMGDISEWLKFSTAQLLEYDPERVAHLLVNQKHDREGLISAWRGVIKKDLKFALKALMRLQSDGEWPSDVWIWTLYTIGPKVLTSDAATDAIDRDTLSSSEYKKNWELFSDIFVRIPNQKLSEIVDSAAHWIQDSPPPPKESLNQRYWELWDRLWVSSEVWSEGVIGDSDSLITDAFNHPTGKLTIGLLNRIQVDRSITEAPNDLLSRFDKIIGSKKSGAYFGRVMIASEMLSLFNLDSSWTEKNVIPLMDWGSSSEASGLWQGFMLNPRFSISFLRAFKAYLLGAVKNSAEIEGIAGVNLRRTFTFLALEFTSEFRKEEIRGALASMAAPQISNVARALEVYMKNTGGNADKIWNRAVSKFVRTFWPTSNVSKGKESSKALASVAMATCSMFPQAVNVLTPYIVAEGTSDSILWDFRGDKKLLAQNYPEATLDLLYAYLIRKPGSSHSGLEEVLEMISSSKPALSNRNKFKELLRLA